MYILLKHTGNILQDRWSYVGPKIVLTNLRRWKPSQVSFFWVVLGLRLRATPLVVLCDGFFPVRGSCTNCLGWLWTVILLISASWVATGAQLSSIFSNHMIRKLETNTGSKPGLVVSASHPALNRLRQEDYKFESSLSYIASSRPTWAA
jgi:hypothetical protein